MVRVLSAGERTFHAVRSTPELWGKNALSEVMLDQEMVAAQ